MVQYCQLMCDTLRQKNEKKTYTHKFTAFQFDCQQQTWVMCVCVCVCELSLALKSSFFCHESHSTQIFNHN